MTLPVSSKSILILAFAFIDYDAGIYEYDEDKYSEYGEIKAFYKVWGE